MVLAIGLAGSAALAGPATAALPPAPSGSTPVATTVTAAEGAVGAFIGHRDDYASNVVVTLADTRWAAGDRVMLTLPTGYSFAALPGVAVAPVAAAGTTYAPQVSASWVDGTKNAIYVTFTDSAPASAATADLDLGLVVANQDIAVPATATPGAVHESVQGQDTGTTTWKVYGSPVVATATHYGLFSSEVHGIVAGAGAQSIDGVGLDEAGATDMVNGIYTITLTGATFADPAGATLISDVEEDGSALTLGPGGIHLVPGDPHSITVDVAGTNTVLQDGFLLQGLRASATAVGPISAALTAVPAGATPLGTTVTTDPGQYEAAYPALARLGGATRLETAAQIAAKVATSATDTVILTNSGQGSAGGVSIDALSASYLSGAQAHPTPILLTDAGSLPATTAAAIRSTLPNGGKVIVLGGVNAVSDAVITAVTALGSYSVTRVQGGDRYASAQAAAVAGAALRPVGTFSDSATAPAVKTAILASGTNPVDALSAGQVSAEAGLPLLLTAPTGLPAATAGAISALGIKRILLVGGTVAVSDAVVSQLAAAGVVVTRFAGANRYQTATSFLDRMNASLASAANSSAPYGVAAGLDASGTRAGSTAGIAYVANGNALADAAVAGPLAAATGSPLLLTPNDNGSLGDDAFGEVITLPIRQVVGIGATGVLSDDVLAMANRYADLD